jgi:hypothetical protein
MDSISGEPALAWYWIVVIVAAAALLIVGLWVWMKTRRRPGDHVFRASRLSRGNRIFPAQVVITPTSVTLHHAQWIGRREESIHMAHVASVKIDTNIIFSNVLIETTGGHHPIVCYGHTKGDAVRMKQLMEKFQTEHYTKK